jgi:uncharacterized phage protein gp47/JayE
LFEDKTPENIKRDILAALITDIDKREGSFADDMSGPQAVELFKMYGTLNKLQYMVWVNEGSGIYLDMAAEDLGIVPRKSGSKASVILEISGKPGFEIPAGTTFLTKDGLCFDAGSAAIIRPDGSVLVSATAREIGEKYNTAPNTVSRQFLNNSNISKITNPEAAVGGANPESDKSLYARIVFARLKPATSGNKYHYEEWALEVPGVGAVRVFPLWAGNGTVKVVIADGQRQPVDAGIVAACAEHIESVRPIGPEVTVVSAENYPIDISVSLVLEPSATENGAKAGIEAAINEHFEEIALNDSTVRLHEICAIIINVPGILDYGVVQLNGAESSIFLSDGQVPILGEVMLL